MNGLLDERTEFSLAPLAAPATCVRLCEFSLARAAIVALTDALPDHEVIRQCGCDGCFDGVRVHLLEPASLLHLLDDDKVRGLAQASLLDMWWTHRGHALSSSPSTLPTPAAESRIRPLSADSGHTNHNMTGA